jgi:hypothetical protein
LGQWLYDPAGEGAPEVFPLVNVLYWDIQHRDNTPPTLVFRRKSGSKIERRVRLLRDGNDEVHVLIAHIPLSEQGQLPPNSQPTLQTPPDTQSTPTHFEHFYDALRPRPASRPLPRFVRSTAQKPCPIMITTGNREKSANRLASLGTYSCVMATADEGS